MAIEAVRRKTRNAEDISPSTTTLTTAYAAGWESSFFNCGPHGTLTMLLTVAVADSTSIELRADVEDFPGSDGHEKFRVAGGAASPDEIVITSAQVPGSGKIALPHTVNGASRIKWRAKKTGGAGTATLTLELIGR